MYSFFIVSKKVANLFIKKLCTKSSKHDIMHSAKLKTMCSAKGFCDANNLKKAYGARLFDHVMIFSMPFPFACCTEMMGLIGAGNNPMVGMTVAVAVAIEEASK